MKLPEHVYKTMEYISTKGNVYLVGGAIRNTILNLPISDYDLCTDVPLEQLFPDKKIMKNDNREIIFLNDQNIELSTMKGNTILEDLSHRDFTMNAIAMDINGNIIDPYQGQKDIQNKKIKTISNECFTQDPCRILRAIRFSCELDFEIVDDITEYKDLLKTIKTERIREEFYKILLLNPGKIEEYKDIFFVFLPELNCEIVQNNPYHIYNIFKHIIETTKHTPLVLELRLAALFHDIGKVKCKTTKNGIDHFYGHDKISSQMFMKIAKRLKIDHKTTNKVNTLILNHEFNLSFSTKAWTRRILKYDLDIEQLFLLRKADISAQNPIYLNRLEDYDKKEKEIIQLAKKKNIKIKGDYFVSKDVEPKNIGKILRELQTKVLLGQIENEEGALKQYADQRYRKYYRNNE